MVVYFSDLTTREDVRNQLMRADLNGTDPAPVNSEDADFVEYVDSAIHSMSKAISLATHRVFVPYKDTKFWYFSDSKFLRNFLGTTYEPQLSLNEDLLVTSSITWDGSVLSASYFRELPYNELPYYAILFDRANLPSYGSDFDTSLQVAGIWGYHTNLNLAWETVSASVTLANATVTSLTVSDASLYKTWQYIRIEDEYLQITARNESTEVLTVRRGVNGTTAAAHTTQACQVFKPLPDIELAATRLVCYAYVHRNDRGNQVEVLPDGTVNLNTVPLMVQQTLRNYQKHSWGAV